MKKLNAIIAEDARDLRPPAGLRDRLPLSSGAWAAAVGDRIAARTKPVRLERGVLHIRAATAAWANELSLLSDEILQHLHLKGIDAQRLRFSVGPVERSPREKRADKPVYQPPPCQPLPAALSQQIATIEHRGLREALARAASRRLAPESSD